MTGWPFPGLRILSFAITLAVIPAIVQIIIMLVNGNIGAGIAVAGAFSLVRFRSLPGTAKEIASIFLAMAIGLATGMGYIYLDYKDPVVLFHLYQSVASPSFPSVFSVNGLYNN